MKSLLVIIISLITTTALSQWSYKRIDNGFDDPYVMGYATGTSTAYLKLENYNNGVSFYISGVYICDDNIDVDLSFNISGSYYKHTIAGNTSQDHETVFILDDITSDSTFLQNFKDASTIKIRLNDHTCEVEIYEFSMRNSKAAYEAVLKQ